MPQRTDIFDLGRLGLSSGEGRRLDLHTAIGPFDYGGQAYAVAPELIPVRLDASRTTASGYALRLRFGVALSGPCMRCLEPANPSFEVDAREVHQPTGGEELDLAGWTRDALALELPAQLTCREDCLGLCGQCGANLNEDPDHAHEAPPDQRWAKLSELKFD